MDCSRIRSSQTYVSLTPYFMLTSTDNSAERVAVSEHRGVKQRMQETEPFAFSYYESRNSPIG